MAGWEKLNCFLFFSAPSNSGPDVTIVDTPGFGDDVKV